MFLVPCINSLPIECNRVGNWDRNVDNTVVAYIVRSVKDDIEMIGIVEDLLNLDPVILVNFNRTIDAIRSPLGGLYAGLSIWMNSTMPESSKVVYGLPDLKMARAAARSSWSLEFRSIMDKAVVIRGWRSTWPGACWIPRHSLARWFCCRWTCLAMVLEQYLHRTRSWVNLLPPGGIGAAAKCSWTPWVLGRPLCYSSW